MLDVRAIMTNRDPKNPYKFNGVSYAPEVLSRVMRSPEDVVRVIAEAKVVHEVTHEQILERTGMAETDLCELEQEGRGTMANLLQVLDAVGVSPVTLPCPANGMR